VKWEGLIIIFSREGLIEKDSKDSTGEWSSRWWFKFAGNSFWHFAV